MASADEIQDKFLNALNDSRDLFTYCRSPAGPHTNPGIESAFLDAFKSWEVFLEELTIAYLTGEPDVDGNFVPAFICVSDPGICRGIINDDRSYINWASPDIVKKIFKLYFEPSTMDRILNTGIGDLIEMFKCRNAIAHSSSSARTNLEDLFSGKSGISKPAVRSADVLLLAYNPDPPSTWFDRYLHVLETLSQDLLHAGTLIT